MPQLDFEILNIEAWTSLDVNRNPYNSYRITFRTRHGDVGHVEVPAAGYTASRGQQAVAAAAKELIATRS